MLFVPLVAAGVTVGGVYVRPPPPPTPTPVFTGVVGQKGLLETRTDTGVVTSEDGLCMPLTVSYPVEPATLDPPSGRNPPYHLPLLVPLNCPKSPRSTKGITTTIPYQLYFGTQQKSHLRVVPSGRISRTF